MAAFPWFGWQTSLEYAKEEEDTQKTDLGEVVVRAKPRLEKLKEIPASASVRTGQELQRELAIDLGSILAREGNVKWNNGNSRTSSLSMRGIGQQAQTDAMDPSVGTVVDGVPYAYNPLTSFDFFDIDQVQVDRGPQGTAGGKNFSLGQVNVSTRRPTFNREATYSGTYGEYNTYIADAAVGGAVIDNTLAWRGAVHINKSDGGSAKNIWNTDQTYYNRDRVAGRIQLLFTPTENFDARVSFDVQPQSKEFFNGNTFFTPTPNRYANGGVNALNTDASTRLARRWFVQGDPSYTYKNNYLYGGGQYVFNQDNQFPLVTASKGGSAELNWNVNGFKVTSITAARDYSFQARNDEGTPFDISKNGGGAVPDFLQISEELKVSSNFGNLVDYTAGLYMMDRRMTKGNKTGFGSDAGAWFASAGKAVPGDPSKGQYSLLDANASGQSLMKDSLDGLLVDAPYTIRNQTGAIFANAKWHITEPLTLTTGVRFSNENRRQSTQKYIVDNGAGTYLNTPTVNGVETNHGFNTNKLGALTGYDFNHLSQKDINQLSEADKVANIYFGKQITTPGAAYNQLSDANRAQIAAAKNLRSANMSSLWGYEPGRPYRGTQPGYVVSPNYQINDNLSTYLSWQYQEKAGFSQTLNGVATLVAPEKTNSYEIGFKSSLFDKTLTFNTDFFWTEISNYQQGINVVDDFTTKLKNDGTTTYATVTGNAQGVRAYGVEIDASYTGLKYTAINFSGSYNDAIYTKFTTLGNPAENGNNPNGTGYYDASGKHLPGAAQFTFSFSPEVRYPVDWHGANEVHSSFTTTFTSDYNSDVSLSSYAWIRPNSYTDFSLGVGRRDKSFDVSLVGKNIFHNSTPYGVTWNGWTPGLPQWFGVMVSGKF